MAHKFQPMPGNKKPTLCNVCLERKGHENHYTDSTKSERAKDRAALHRALDAVLDRKAAKDAYPVPTAALKSPAAAKKFLENIVEKMQSTYSKEEDARQRYKDASNDQRRSRDLSAKWDAASAKVAEVEKDFQTALKTIQAAIPGFQDPT